MLRYNIMEIEHGQLLRSLCVSNNPKNPLNNGIFNIIQN